MGIFRFFGRTILRPYSRMASDLSKSKDRIQAGASQIKNTLNPDKNIRYIDAKTSKEAFEKIYKLENWTEKELQEQLIALRRAKWVAMISAWLTFCIYVGVLIYGGSKLVALVATVFAALMLANFLVRALKWSLFQAQVEERNLLSLKEFWDLPDKWRRIFS